MKSVLVGMLAETFIHPGSGQSLGFVDKPVARESVTDYPVIVGSALKGALKDKVRNEGDNEKISSLFGEKDNAGNVLVSDARLLLLPVRCLTGQYKWLTCPYILERLQRDLARTGKKQESFHKYLLLDSSNSCLSSEKKGEILFLEEREFNVKSEIHDSILNALASFFPNEDTKKRLKEQLVIVNNDDFAWFARYGLNVQARNSLDENTKSSLNLWYEESLSPDTLMYTVLFERQTKGNSLQTLVDLFSKNAYLQAGGNETIGQGWFALQTVQ